ncbi:leucine-rich repeat-containing protein 42-like isoform X2 [Xenia sp. Carnegie-2017]|uniref:leucine-rich repeat-containing protein 42-like isoform X2 n=1 Tax=Xenia sp. Carnegie-2017 TaxID=2897299 RepID=UPI001F03803F|nr:leucine-rich repeat-containing protein 42-like isoform X2 [Xenia sp. Carnegie-2017]
MNSDEFSIEDLSLVYSRDENGILHAPPGYKRFKDHKKKNENAKLQELEAGALTAMNAQQIDINTQISCSLFEICKSFVVKNLHLLESLEHFPEIIGFQLFLEAIREKSFHKDSNNLKIFCLAYKDLILKQLSLQESAVLINEYIHYFECFEHLHSLNLSHCRLGDSHQYLTFTGQIKSLKYFNLKDNCLTDHGLAKWSLPYRMFENGPKFLQVLDLSCNPVLTVACLKSLLKFVHLKRLNLSGTGVCHHDEIQRFNDRMNLCMMKELDEYERIVTEGWAEPFITELNCNLAIKSLRQKDKHCYGKSASFYRKPKTCTPSMNKNGYPVILLHSLDSIKPGTIRALTTSDNYGKRRRMSSHDNESLKRRKILMRKEWTIYSLKFVSLIYS